MLLAHILDYAADALRALDELSAESLVCLSLVALAEVAKAIGICDTADDTVSEANEHESVEH